MKTLLPLLFLALVFACGTTKTANDSANTDLNIQLLIQTNFIHCGGAPPPKGGFSTAFIPLGERVYYLKSGVTNDHQWENAIKINTNEEGMDSLMLKPGAYVLVGADKILDYVAFREKTRNKSTYYEETSEDCFKDWYNSPDYTFVVEKDSMVTITLKQRCFVGFNPCIKYIGPMPQ